MGDAPLLRHGRRLDDEETGTGQREVAEVDHVPVRGEAAVCGVLAHRRNGDPVDQLQRAELDRRKQLAHG
jgi:hypothetical protein